MLGPNSRQRAVRRNPDTAQGEKERCAEERHRSSSRPLASEDRAALGQWLRISGGLPPPERQGGSLCLSCLFGHRVDAERLLSFWEPGMCVCRAEGLRCHTAAGTHGGGLWTRHLVSTLPMSRSFVGCGQCSFSVINHSHENHHRLNPRESANLGVALGIPEYWENGKPTARGQT